MAQTTNIGLEKPDGTHQITTDVANIAAAFDIIDTLFGVRFRINATKLEYSSDKGVTWEESAGGLTPGQSIVDVNANELIKWIATVASAVNEVTIGNAATGGAPSIKATGDDTNISLLLSGKGTGNVAVTVGSLSSPGLRNMSQGTAMPSGGSAGDIYLKY